MEPVSAWQKILTWTSGVIVSLLLAGAATAYWTIHRSFPQTEGTIEVPALGSSVTVIRDGSGIPQVYAETSADLFYAQVFLASGQLIRASTGLCHARRGEKGIDELIALIGGDILEDVVVIDHE